MEQRSEEWFRARAGKVTASRVADVIAKTKSGYSTSRDNYMAELICQRLTGNLGDSYQNAAMVWGTNTEPLARAAYVSAKGVGVEEVGFVPHPTLDDAGASPDGYVGEEGLIEIKCPLTSTHMNMILEQEIPTKYHVQMQWQMACTGRLFCDFVSFDPRMPENLQLYIHMVDRDNKMIANLEAEVAKFLSEMENKIAKLNKLCGDTDEQV
jgi:putative phage-type endonuclease